MSVRLISLDTIPKATRNRASKITLTPEWKEALTALHKIKAGKALEIKFSSETLKLGKATAQRFKRLLIRELKQKRLDDLKAFFRGKDSRGYPVLYVARE